MFGSLSVATAVTLYGPFHVKLDEVGTGTENVHGDWFWPELGACAAVEKVVPG